MRPVNSIITASYDLLFLRGTKCSPASDYGAGAAMQERTRTDRSLGYPAALVTHHGAGLRLAERRPAVLFPVGVESDFR